MRTARPAKPPRILEKQWQGTVVKAARLLGWKVQFHWREKHSPAGWPDLTLVRGTRIICAELKRDGEKPTEAQEAWLATLRATGKIEVYVWKPADWPEVEATLR